MRVLMTGGGTGGHINPAIAIAKTILEKEPDSVIAFVGTPRGMENRLVPKEGFPLYHVEITGLKRSLSLSNLKTLFLTVTSVGKAKKLIREFRPDLAVGTGGYVCWPVIKAASGMGIPTALHESNALAGVAVRMLASSVDILFTNFESTGEQIRKCKRILHAGNPLKSAFSAVSKEEAREKLGFAGKYRTSLLSCGGSLGAEAINDAVLQLMAEYSSKHPEMHHLHQAGAGNYPAVREKFLALGLDRYPNLELVDYIYDMPLRLAAADVVVNRAGAMTISELAMLKKPAILIPSPNVTDNHQYKNAKALADRDAAILIPENALTPSLLAEKADSLLSDREKMRRMGENIGAFALPDANIFIYNALKELVKTKKV